MSEFIGSRISLVSRSDIRYVGTLHEINSETSTVALENVSSFGTEGRKGNPDEEIPASDSVYEYIVFRGSDVKDLRIEEAPAVKENKPPQVPNDPAILGSGSRPQNFQAPPNQHAPPQQPQGGPPQFPQQYPPQFYPPPPGNWGRGGPPGPGFPGAYGAPPPGWYPPPGQGFPQPPPGVFPYGQYSPGPPGQQGPGQQAPGQQIPGQQGFPQGQGPKPAPIGPGTNKQQGPQQPGQQKLVEKDAAQSAPTSAAKASTPEQPKAAPKENDASRQQATPVAKTPAGPKNGRIMPAIPLQSPAAHKTPLQNNKPPAPASAANPALDDATRAATAAVAAAMAKLPNPNQPNGGNNGVDNLTRKVAEMRTGEPIRAPRHPNNTQGFAAGQRGRGRGGARPDNRKVEVPTTDFDFESANAKFNKQDLVKEAIAGSPLGEQPPNGTEEVAEPSDDVVIPAGSGYNKSTSFFDNISSESKDRAEANGARPGGREWRGKEQALNVETFGQGSVDNGYRGGFRGRGRGRGGMRGRGYGNGQPRGRGGYRGQSEAQ